MRIFFFKHNTSGEIVAARFGETGFFTTDIHTQEHADALNESVNNSHAEITAAEACSMFGWDNFNTLVERLSK